MLKDGSRMARRKAKRRSRPKFMGINLVNGAEAFIQANWLTQGFLNTDPLAALVGKSSAGYGFIKGVSDTGGKKRIAITELLGLGGEDAATNWGYVLDNVKANWLDVAIKTTLTTGGFRIGKRLFRKPRAQINKGFRMLGIGTSIKV